MKKSNDFDDYYTELDQIIIKLPEDTLRYILESLNYALQSHFMYLKTKEDKPLHELKNGTKISLLEDLEGKIFRGIALLEYLLKQDYYQKFLKYEYTFQYEKGNEILRINGEPREELDRHFFPLVVLIRLLIMNEGIIEYPPEIKRFCNKILSLHSPKFIESMKEDWEKIAKQKKNK